MDKLALLFLGFDSDSSPTEEQIKEAFRKISLLVHPDSGGNDKVFRGLTLAKETLLSSIPKKKPASRSEQDDFNDYYENSDYNYHYSQTPPPKPAREEFEIDRDIQTWADLCCKWLHNYNFFYIKRFSIELQNSHKAELVVITDGFGAKPIKFRYFDAISIDDKEALLSSLIWLFKKENFQHYNNNIAFLPNGTEVKFSCIKNPWYARFLFFL